MVVAGDIVAEAAALFRSLAGCGVPPSLWHRAAFGAFVVTKADLNLLRPEKKPYFCNRKDRTYGCTDRTKLETTSGGGV